MVKKQVADLPAIVSKDEAYQNAIKNSDAQNARVESDRATMQAILDSMSTTIELYKAVNENPALCKWIQDMVFATRIRLRRLPKKISLISIETPKDM